MNASETSNPITQRLDKIYQLWQRFRAVPEARICRWLFQADEKKMVEAFLETTYQKNNPAVDFFLPFYTPYTKPESYAEVLLAELNQAVAADTEGLAAEGITLTWSPKPANVAGSPEDIFLQQLQILAQQLPAPEMVVAVLMPTNVTKSFGKWLYRFSRLSIPANIRLLVVDAVEEEILAKATGKAPEQILTYSLDLDMSGAMRQLAAVGNPADPGVKFRKAFLELSQAAASRNLAEVKRLEVSPLVIAREQGWVPMEIAVHSLIAAAYIGLNRLPEALNRYQQAYGLAQKAFGGGEAVGLTLAVQACLNQGSVQIAQKKFREAAAAYALAAEHAQAAGDNFQVMEAKRLQGYCLEKCSDWEVAYIVEKEALAAATLLDEQLRHNSTLPYLGQALLELAYRVGYKEEYLKLEEKMDALAGPDWRSKVKTAKIPAV